MAKFTRGKHGSILSGHWAAYCLLTASICGLLQTNLSPLLLYIARKDGSLSTNEFGLPYNSSVPFFPPTLSELNSIPGSPTCNMWTTFSVLAIIMATVSRYPIILSNAYSGSISLAAMRTIALPFLFITIMNPQYYNYTTGWANGSGFVFNTVLHALGVFGYAICGQIPELHTLFCSANVHIGRIERWVRFAVFVAMLCTFFAFQHFLKVPEGVCCGDEFLDPQWLRAHADELDGLARQHGAHDVHGLSSIALFIANQHRSMLLNTAHGEYLRYKKMSFFLEYACLNLTFLQLFLIWFFCEERKSPTPIDLGKEDLEEASDVSDDEE